jgi:PAS domain S-box-containing protein
LASAALPSLPARLLAEESPIAMWLFDARTLDILWTNRSMRARYGWSDDAAASRAVRELCASVEWLDLYALHGVGDAPAPTFESRHRRADGAILDVDCTVTPFVSEGRQLALVHEVDVTARGAAIEGQRAASARMQFLFTSTSAMIYACAVEPPYATTFVSANVRGALGHESADFLVDPGFWVDHLHPEEREDVLRHVDRIFIEGRLVLEYRFRHADGSYRWLHDELVLTRREDGTPREIIGCFYDVTARKEAEQALRRSESNFRVLIEHLPTAVMIHWEDRIRYVNPALLSVLGYDRAEELIGRSPLTLVAPHWIEFVRKRIDRFAQDPAHQNNPRVESDWVGRDGKSVTFEVESLRIEFDGSPAIAVFADDVTERREILAHLAVSDRMASLGTLAAGVAHEINNPLAYVSSNLAMLAEELPALLEGRGRAKVSVSDVKDLLSDAILGAARVREVVRDLRSLARVDERVLEPVNVREVLESSLRMATNEIRHRARLVQRLHDVPPVLANASRLGQVFLNLLINAAQSIPDGRAASHEIRVATFTTASGEVAVEVSDTGSGIPRELVGRVFDPFFTTKPMGVGTGLGLSICHRIVTSLNGRISAESAPGEGATFRVVLPAMAQAESIGPDSNGDPEPVAAPQRGRVLVIDDEPKLANAIRMLLVDQHDVVAVTRARDALTLLQAGEQFDAALCDLMMPEINGAEFHEWVSRTTPSFAPRIVFLTGGAFTDTTREFLTRVENACLEKPFDPAVLRSLIAEVVATSSTAQKRVPQGQPAEASPPL